LEPSLGFPGLRYVLLHSLSHALIRHFSGECGYATASLRERIYSSTPDDEESMAGILIYTAPPDSEGTLGGLVTLGETANLKQHLDQALEGLEICSSDPLCAESLSVGSDYGARGVRVFPSMTTAEACLRLVEELPGSLVESLIRQLRSGTTPAMPSPGYQGRVDGFIRSRSNVRSELAPMLEVALVAKRSRQTTELVWTGLRRQ
jgi:Domain of unknown function (DUF1998)